MRRFLGALFIAAIFLAGLTSLAAEGPSMPERMEYQEGVVARGSLAEFSFFARLEELEIAYIECDMPFLAKGQTASWYVAAAGGDGNYEYEFGLYYRQSSKDAYFLRCAQRPRGKDNSFACNINYDKGEYVLKVIVYDELGHYLEWNRPLYITSDVLDTRKINTVPGKVTYIVDQCLEEAGESPFSRALWLHDWLINHAEYDTTYTYYGADGVLLHGRGVCQSYALAYQMLLKTANIDCLYITGEAGGAGHAWNLVKLDGQWYHVDCTWDDPVGSRENHAYFALTDEQMAVDHSWDLDNGVLPECTSTDNSYFNVLYTPNTQTAQEGMTKLRGAFQRKSQSLYLIFPDVDTAMAFTESVLEWAKEQIKSGALNGMRHEGVWDIHREGNQIAWELYYADENSIRVCDLRLDYGSGFAEPTEVVYARFISDKVVVWPGSEVKPSLYCVPANGTGITWTSSNSAVATVVNGVVTVHTSGMAVITARIPSGETTSCLVFGTNFEDTVIEGDIWEIEEEAFCDCRDIQRLIIRSGVAKIGTRAFAGCTSLITAEIPASVVFIAPDAFADCPGLTIICPDNSAAAAFAERAGIPHKRG